MSDAMEFTNPVWQTALRGTAVYIALVLLIRLVPKRNAGHVSPNDLLTLIVVGGLGTDAATGGAGSIADILLLVAVILGWAFLLDVLEYRIPLLRRVLRDKPAALIEDGRLLRRNMRRELVTEDELMAALRKEAIDDPAQVRRAYMEADGEISVIRKGTDLS